MGEADLPPVGSEGAAGPAWKRSSANPRPLRAHGQCAAAGGLLGPLNICGRRGACGHQGGDGGLTELSGGDRISPGNQRWLNRRPCQSLLTGGSALRDRTTVCVDRERQRQRSPCDHLAPCVGGGVTRQPARTGRRWTRPPSPGPRDQPRRAPPALASAGTCWPQVWALGPGCCCRHVPESRGRHSQRMCSRKAGGRSGSLFDDQHGPCPWRAARACALKETWPLALGGAPQWTAAAAGPPGRAPAAGRACTLLTTLVSPPPWPGLNSP